MFKRHYWFSPHDGRRSFLGLHSSIKGIKKVLFVIIVAALRLSCFLFFVLPTLPTQSFFFQFYFCISLRVMPVQYWSSIRFPTASRLIKLSPVTVPGEILP